MSNTVRGGWEPQYCPTLIGANDSPIAVPGFSRRMRDTVLFHARPIRGGCEPQYHRMPSIARDYSGWMGAPVLSYSIRGRWEPQHCPTLFGVNQDPIIVPHCSGWMAAPAFPTLFGVDWSPIIVIHYLGWVAAPAFPVLFGVDGSPIIVLFYSGWMGAPVPSHTIRGGSGPQYRPTLFMVDQGPSIVPYYSGWIRSPVSSHITLGRWKPHTLLPS